MRIDERRAGSKCWVVDGLFTMDRVISEHEALLARRDLAFSNRPPAPGSTPLLLSNYVRSSDPDWERKLLPIYADLHRLCERLCGIPLSFDRGQVNYTLHGDRRMVHRDTGSDVTALYYANSEWHRDWMGETLIYDQTETEVLAAVTPRPGRVLVFDSELPHRVGVPSSFCSVPRIGVVARYVSKGGSWKAEKTA